MSVPIVVTQASAGTSAWIPLDDTKNPFQVGFGVVAAGTLTYTIEHTFDNVQNPAITPTAFPNATVTARTGNAQGNYTFPVTAVRINVTAFTGGSVTLTLVQGTSTGSGFNYNPVTGADLAAELAATQQTSLLRLWLPGDQSTGDALDLSGGARNLVPAGTMTTGELWATPLQMTFPGGTGKYAECPVGVGSVTDIDLLITSTIVSFRIKKSAPAGPEYIIGRALPRGWFMQALTNGDLKLFIRGGASEELFSYTVATGVFDGTWKHVIFAFDAATKTAFIWVNKVLTYSVAVALTKTTSNTTTGFSVGNSAPGVGAPGYELALDNLQIYALPSVISINMQRIVRKLYSTALPLSAEDLV